MMILSGFVRSMGGGGGYWVDMSVVEVVVVVGRGGDGSFRGWKMGMAEGYFSAHSTLLLTFSIKETKSGPIGESHKVLTKKNQLEI
jgi:hypothetical protein